MQMIFLTLMVIILPGIAVGEDNIGMLVTLITDRFTHINFYEGDPSTEADNMTTRSYTFSYLTAQIWSIATDFRKGEIFVMRNVPGDIARLDNVSIWLNYDVTETVFHRGISNKVSQIAVDWIHGNVYWTDGGFQWIVMQSSRTNDTSMYIVLIHDLQQPFGLAVDPINGYIFWSDIGDSPHITRATLSGEESKVLIHNGMRQPSGIALDYTARRVYWVDGNRIDFMDYDGGNRQMFYHVNGALFISLFSYKDIICVADLQIKRIISFNKDTHKATNIWSDLPGIPTDITMFGELAQPYIEDVCAGKMCDHLCVKYQNASKCLCKNGYHIIDDGTSCEEDSTAWKQEVVIGIDSQICTLDVRWLITSDGAKYSCPIETGGDVNDIEIDMNNGILFYHRDAVIYRHPISNSTEDKLVESTGEIGGMVYDWLDDNLYWTEQDSNRIMMVSVETRVQLPVLENITSPGSITADPHQSTLFWISNSLSQTIQSCNMDGSDVKDLFSGTDLYQSTDLTIDIKAGRIYWLNYGHIKSMKIDGTDIQTEFITFSRSNHIATYKDYVFWTEDLTSKLRTYAKSNLKEQKSYTLPDRITSLAVFDTELQGNEKGPCWVNNGGCDHVCVPMVTSRVCRCELGYTLQTDGKVCETALIDSNYFLLSDSTHEQIYQVSLSNGDIVALDIDNVGSVLGIVYHEDKQKVYWSDTNVGIKSATLNSRTGTTILKIYGNVVRQLDIDKETSNIYYTASGMSKTSGYLAVFNEDLQIHKTLISGLDEPQAIVLRPSKGVMYWTDTGPGKIFKSNMDGTDSQEIGTDLVWPNGLALDNTANKLYYADGYTDNIGFIDLNGYGMGTFAEDADAYVWDIAVAVDIKCIIDTPLMSSISGIDFLHQWSVNQHVQNVNFVTKMNMNKSSDTTRIAQHAEFGKLYSIYIVSDQMEPRNIVCATRNGQCSQLCLPTNDRRTCACGDGVDLNPDGRSCVTDKLCSNIIQNGALSPSCLRYEEEVCTFSCSEGYELAVGNNSLRCKTGGEWNVPTDGLCQEIGCEETLANGQLFQSCSGRVGQECDFQCIDGYRKTTETKLICLASRIWNVDMSSVCEAITCLAKIPNGKLRDGCNPKIGTLCSYSCNEGYTMGFSVSTLTCLSIGKWSPDVTSVCRRILCPLLVPNGQISHDCDGEIGATCSFNCISGYDKNPDVQTLICSPTGVWTSTLSDLCTKTKPPSKLLSTEMIIGVLVGTGGFIILILVGIIIACVIHRNRRPQHSNTQFVGIQNPVFEQTSNPYTTFNNGENYSSPMKPVDPPPNISDVGATSSNYVSNLDRDQEYFSIDETKINGPADTAFMTTTSSDSSRYPDDNMQIDYTEDGIITSDNYLKVISGKEDTAGMEDYIRPAIKE